MITPRLHTLRVVAPPPSKGARLAAGETPPAGAWRGLLRGRRSHGVFSKV